MHTAGRPSRQIIRNTCLLHMCTGDIVCLTVSISGIEIYVLCVMKSSLLKIAFCIVKTLFRL